MAAMHFAAKKSEPGEVPHRGITSCRLRQGSSFPLSAVEREPKPWRQLGTRAWCGRSLSLTELETDLAQATYRAVCLVHYTQTCSRPGMTTIATRREARGAACQCRVQKWSDNSIFRASQGRWPLVRNRTDSCCTSAHALHVLVTARDPPCIHGVGREGGCRVDKL